MKTRFCTDFISAIPLDLMASGLSEGSKSKRLFKLFSLLKLLRILRLARLIRALNQAREAKVRLKLTKVLIQLLLYLHCCACMWLYIIEFDGLWFNSVY